MTRTRTKGPQRQIAKQFGITPERVRQILVSYEVRSGERLDRPHEISHRERERKRLTPPPSLAQTILSRSELRGECWVWTGSTAVIGGKVRPRFRSFYVDRLAFHLWIESIGRNDWLVNDCGVPLCINPWHAHTERPAAVLHRSPHWDHERGTWKHAPQRMSRTLTDGVEQ